jgi:hypothetical protein
MIVGKGKSTMDSNREEHERHTAWLSALTTEHFVLQTATGTTDTEANVRSSLYVMALSSSLVAMGFLASSPEAFFPFAATVLPTLFVLGVFTVASPSFDARADRRLSAAARPAQRPRFRRRAACFQRRGTRCPRAGAPPSADR